MTRRNTTVAFPPDVVEILSAVGNSSGYLSALVRRHESELRLAHLVLRTMGWDAARIAQLCKHTSGTRGEYELAWDFCRQWHDPNEAAHVAARAAQVVAAEHVMRRDG